MADFSAWTPEDWTAAGTLATAVVAFMAATFAGWQVLEVRRTRREEARPFVIVDIQPSLRLGNALNLVIENVGRTVARNVKMTFDPPLESSQEWAKDATGSGLLTGGIATLPPHRRIQALFDLADTRKVADLPLRYDVIVRFDDYQGRKQDELRYVIDLAPFYDITSLDERTVHDAARSLDEMQKTMKKWTQHQNGIRVWTQDEDRRLLDDRIEHDLTGHHPVLGRSAPSDLTMALGRSVLLRSLIRNVRTATRILRDRTPLKKSRVAPTTGGDEAWPEGRSDQTHGTRES